MRGGGGGGKKFVFFLTHFFITLSKDPHYRARVAKFSGFTNNWQYFKGK